MASNGVIFCREVKKKYTIAGSLRILHHCHFEIWEKRHPNLRLLQQIIGYYEITPGEEGF